MKIRIRPLSGGLGWSSSTRRNTRAAEAPYAKSRFEMAPAPTGRLIAAPIQKLFESPLAGNAGLTADSIDTGVRDAYKD